MPAKPLSPEQRAEADALRRRYNNFTYDLRVAGKPWTQEAIAAQLGFTQSNLNQYLGGKIPLGSESVLVFARFFGVSPRDISPIVTAETVARAKEWLVAAGETAAYWPFEAVKFQRWDRLRERQKGEVEKAMNLALDEIESTAHSENDAAA